MVTRKEGDVKYDRVASMLEDKLQGLRASLGDHGASEFTELLEIAAQEFGIKTDQSARRKKQKPSAVGYKIEKKQTFCTHVCDHHKELINPKIWGTLPEDLLQPVFAHLPPEKIGCMQFLSNEWQQNMTSNFYQECEENYPKMLGLITKVKDNVFWVRVLDCKRLKWHTYQLLGGGPPNLKWSSMRHASAMIAACGDAGLVCIVTAMNFRSKGRRNCPSLFINVMDPLTRVSRELPLLVKVRDVQQVQIQVDRRTKEFKVFVWAFMVEWNLSVWQHDGHDCRRVYDSLTNEWIPAPNFWDLDFGQHYLSIGKLPTREKVNLKMIGRPIRSGVSSSQTHSARYKDRIYVLRMDVSDTTNYWTASNESSMYYIEEFHYEMVWVKVKTHGCNPFERPSKTRRYSMRLYASSGFLMVIAELQPCHFRGRFENSIAWLYDLSTSKWSTLQLPKLPQGLRTIWEGFHKYNMQRRAKWFQTWRLNRDLTNQVTLICEPQWTCV